MPVLIKTIKLTSNAVYLYRLLQIRNEPSISIFIHFHANSWSKKLQIHGAK